MKRHARRGQREPVVSQETTLHVGCGGKRCYDRAAAMRLAKRMRRNLDQCVEGYHCMVCKQWHIGTPKPKRRRPQPEGIEA